MARNSEAYVIIILIIGIAICSGNNVEFEKSIIEKQPWTTLLYHTAASPHNVKLCIANCVRIYLDISREEMSHCISRCIVDECTRRFPKKKDEHKMLECTEELLHNFFEELLEIDREIKKVWR
ncbi:hypothetical protein PIB30_084499 [Stylosanthes scabra]|uniref:Uncharacterized protein n=1 Tax=Stylosanthes scabra TaxID=79078 RepID=A0ABU6RSF8_9FABA|nr:hypothetical protein [Stylosanthes scabra]